MKITSRAYGRDHRTHAELALDDDDIIRGLRVETHANVGGYGLGIVPVLPTGYGRLLSHQYSISAIYCRTHSVFMNTAPIHTYRGPGDPRRSLSPGASWTLLRANSTPTWHVA